MQQTKQETKFVPIVELNGTEFLVAVEKRQFRNFCDTNEIIEMHSPKGRQIVGKMAGTQWRTFALAED